MPAYVYQDFCITRKTEKKMAKNNPYLPMQVKIAKKEQMTDDTVLFTIKTKMNPAPGQFIQMSLAGIGECPISICSNNKNQIELLLRKTGNVTKHIFGLKKGDYVGIRGPYGHGYPMDEMAGKEIIVIAGGTGIAPPKSVIEYINNNRNKYGKVRIYAGFREPKEKLFACFLGQCSEMHELCLTYDKAPKDSGCKTGFVTDVVDEAEINPENTAAVICGPPVMMNFMVPILRKKGFHESQIYLSYERHMKCGIGKCGHCSVSGKYVCKDGPVFRLDEAKNLVD